MNFHNRTDHLKVTLIVLLSMFVISIYTDVSASSLSQYNHLEILYTNDVYGHLFPFRYADEDNVGGAARRATLIRKIKAESKYPVLVLDAGNIFVRGPLEDDLGEPDINVMNAMEYDAMTLGDRDMNGGYKLEGTYIPFKGARLTRFPLLCANLLWNDTGKAVMQESTILHKGDLKIAIFGLTSQGMNAVVNTYGMTVMDPIQTAKEVVQKLNGKADMIIAITHIGFNMEKELAKEVPDIDVIVGGGGHHETTSLTTPLVIPSRNDFSDAFALKGPIIVQDGEFGTTLGRLSLNLRRDDDRKYQIMSCNGHLEKLTDDIPPAPDVKGILDRASKELRQPLGNCSRSIIPNGNRGNEMDVWIAEIMRRILHTDIGAHTFDADEGLHKGSITKLDVRMMLPYNNTLSIVEMTPVQFEELKKNPGVTISGNPPLGVTKILVATEDYLANKMQAQGCIIRNTDKTVSSALMEYIANKKTVGNES